VKHLSCPGLLTVAARGRLYLSTASMLLTGMSMFTSKRYLLSSDLPWGAYAMPVYHCRVYSYCMHICE